MSRSRSRRQAIVRLAAPLVPITMAVAMGTARRRRGRDKGYVAGFVVYWVLWCTAFPLAAIGWRPLWARTQHCGRAPRAREVALLAAGPAATLVSSGLPARRELDVRLIGSAALVGIVNGTLEEVLWRALYVELFPDDPVRGCIYPSLWFGLWHIAPQRVHASDRPAALILGSTLLGLLWCAVAQRTRSIRWTIASHVLTDAADVSSPNVRFLAGR